MFGAQEAFGQCSEIFGGGFFFWGGGKERSCMEPGVELDDPCGSLRTQDIL